MKETIKLLPAVILACLNGFAQQSPKVAFEYRVIAQPGMTIGGHLFSPKTTVESAALNDLGGTAFVAHWIDAGAQHGAVFTANELVAYEGDVIDGKRIVAITNDCKVAINAAGQIAFSAAYTENPLDAWTDNTRWGTFLTDRLALTSEDHQPPQFTLTDDGRVLPFPGHKFAPSRYMPIPTLPKHAPLERFQIGKLKLPGLADTKAQTQQPSCAADRPCYPASPFADLRGNLHGQFLIPINFPPGGFILLLATPTTR